MENLVFNKIGIYVSRDGKIFEDSEGKREITPKEDERRLSFL